MNKSPCKNRSVRVAIKKTKQKKTKEIITAKEVWMPRLNKHRI